ncbi:hypothetical protein [Actinokineospora sp. NBRC 105648]|uniref:Rv0361 family membrane protein n=1 Tax=Actinokineospora sp. NBRC 105648 TaxID=3032206 RepID=UPI0024A4779C|nr:hypothetical protein [Actinokineospora sp. NBRC 105648]GLZ37313.1 hypothetical protein Acsp05_09380 [Actinokineospora sp. NBRC 105648]
MTYPPQQPDPHGHQPQYPGPQPHQGGYPRQPPAPGQYQQPGAYSGQPGPHPYGTPYGPPRPSRTPWLIAGGGLLAIGLVVTLVLVLTGGADTGTARGTAEAMVEAMAGNDVAAYNRLVCDEDAKVTDRAGERDRPKVANAQVTEVKETGDKATATFTATVDGKPQTARIRLRKQGETWCVDRFSAP